MYVRFQVLESDWKAGLRPLIGFDGTFLQEKCKKILLVAMTQDSAKYFYPLARTVIDKETSRIWKWFMELLRSSSELKKGEGVTFYVRHAKGTRFSTLNYYCYFSIVTNFTLLTVWILQRLINVIDNVLPKSHHRWCARHIEAN